MIYIKCFLVLVNSWGCWEIGNLRNLVDFIKLEFVEMVGNELEIV